jgi:poly(3-hydroxybutyrate) depolymerase
MGAMRTLSALIGTVALGLSTVVASAAAAAPAEVVSEPYAYHSFDCGYPIDVAGEFTSAAVVRTRSPNEPNVSYFHGRLSFREVWTNVDTGAWFVIRGTWLEADVTAKLVADNVYEYTVIQAGQPLVIEDSTGRVIARDRGVIRFRIQFDTDGNFVDFRGPDVRGPHSSHDPCRYAADLIGLNNSTSSQRYALRPVGTTASPLGYAEYLPPSYGQAPSPLLVFLHGAGEGGDGSADALARQTAQAIPRHIANDGWPDARPFVVLAPQHDGNLDDSAYQHCFDLPFDGSCLMRTQHDLGHPRTGSFCATPNEVHDFIAYAVAKYNVDPSRVYLTGLSCGGFGTWEYLATYGDRQVAAAVPIAGEGRPAWETSGCGLASVPIWAFHGALDEVVNPNGSIVPVTGLRNQCGVADKEAGLTVYPDRDHDAWNITYAQGSPVDIYTWLLDHVSP